MREDPKIKIGRIKKALEYNKELAKPAGFLKGREKIWGVHDSQIENFEYTFYKVLPGEFTTVEKDGYSYLEPLRLQYYIEKTLEKEEGNKLTAVEFGGPGSILFRGFEYGFFDQTAGVCLADTRTDERKKVDTENQHYVLEGDIMDVVGDKQEELLNKIKDKLKTKKTDLIISRMQGPLGFLNLNEAILDRIIRGWYEFLNENGLMFIQFGFEELKIAMLRPKIDMWAHAIQKKYPEIDIQIGDDSLRIHKRKGSPEKLPSVAQLFK